MTLPLLALAVLAYLCAGLHLALRFLAARSRRSFAFMLLCGPAVVALLLALAAVLWGAHVGWALLVEFGRRFVRRVL